MKTKLFEATQVMANFSSANTFKRYSRITGLFCFLFGLFWLYLCYFVPMSTARDFGVAPLPPSKSRFGGAAFALCGFLLLVGGRRAADFAFPSQGAPVGLIRSALLCFIIAVLPMALCFGLESYLETNGYQFQYKQLTYSRNR